jgi:predicted transcriptional regulator
LSFENGQAHVLDYGLPLMAMHNPPHPGDFITEVYLKPNNLTARELAGKLNVAASTLHRVLIGKRHQPGNGTPALKSARPFSRKLAGDAIQP